MKFQQSKKREQKLTVADDKPANRALIYNISDIYVGITLSFGYDVIHQELVNVPLSSVLKPRSEK